MYGGKKHENIVKSKCILYCVIAKQCAMEPIINFWFIFSIKFIWDKNIKNLEIHNLTTLENNFFACNIIKFQQSSK